MAKTNGQRNPAWTRDETILALNLFFEAGMKALSDTDSRVILLSEKLRSLPGNEERALNPKFRNPSGVSFKLFNLKNLAAGGGFANVSATDRSVWAQFESRRSRVKKICELIEKYVSEAPLNVDGTDDQEEFIEGSVVTTMHRRIERNRKLRANLLKTRRLAGSLRCDACSLEDPSHDPRLRGAVFEVHHLIPLNFQGRTKTRLDDTALLCANCHRLIHRLIAQNGTWTTIAALREALADPSTSEQKL